MSEIKLKPTGGGEGSVSLKAPAATTGNADVPFILPVADGSAGQYLKTDGSKNLSFADAGGTWVKLSQVTNGGTVNDITFDSLDTTTYRAFKFIGGMQPATDNVELRYRHREGGADLDGTNYNWGFMVAYPDDSHLAKAESLKNSIRLFDNGGNNTREGWCFELMLFPHVDGHASQIGNYITWQGYRLDGSAAFRTSTGSAHYEQNDEYVNGFKLYASSGDFAYHNYTLYGIKA
tara:strand:- start:251 stop:952 length:702 start_codon:yes stop_codon:yes gene_type:complete